MITNFLKITGWILQAMFWVLLFLGLDSEKRPSIMPFLIAAMVCAIASMVVWGFRSRSAAQDQGHRIRNEDPSDEHIQELQNRIDANLTDYAAQFELGSALCGRGKFLEAILPLTVARSDSRYRMAALRLLVDAFTARRMFDLAEACRREIDGDEPPTAGRVVRK